MSTQWRTSSYTGHNGNCVEVGTRATVRLVRDTKNREGGTLAFPVATFARFIGATKQGQFDLN